MEGIVVRPTMIISISASYLRTLERQLNDGKPFDEETLQLLKDAMNNITDPELARSLKRHMEGWMAVEVGELNRFNSDPDLGAWIQRYARDVIIRAKCKQ
jgi:hypothetical protein